jgi:hypothetical protein
VPSTLTNVAVFDVSRLSRGLLATYGGGGTPTTRLGSRRRRRVALRDSGGLQGVRLRPADQLLGRTSEDALLQACPGEHQAPRRLRRDGQSVGVENERALPWSYKRLRFHANRASARLATASCLGRARSLRRRTIGARPAPASVKRQQRRADCPYPCVSTLASSCGVGAAALLPPGCGRLRRRPRDACLGRASGV